LPVILVVSCNLILSLILLWLAGWFWRWRRYLILTTSDLVALAEATPLALKKTTLLCQEQQLNLLQTRYQYRQLQAYRQQLQQLLTLISLGASIRKAIPSGIGQRFFAKP